MFLRCGIRALMNAEWRFLELGARLFSECLVQAGSERDA